MKPGGDLVAGESHKTASCSGVLSYCMKAAIEDMGNLLLYAQTCCMACSTALLPLPF